MTNWQNLRIDDIAELKALLLNVKTKAVEFLEYKLSPGIQHLSDAVNPSTPQFVDAIGAVLNDLPEFSDNISDECAANLCNLLFVALFYE